MVKAITNYIVDIGMGFSFVIVFITGILKFPQLFFYFRTWNLNWKIITLIHDWSGVILGLLIILHFVLHWEWTKNITRNLFRIKNEN